MSPRPRNEARRPNLQGEIKDIAWKQIAESGAATLSLRAMARELNIAAPSIYNYYPSRDHLVTALIVDAYISLAESLAASVRNLSAEQLPEKLFTLGWAYRQWAVTYSQRYLLIFGTPIPNYHAPEEITMPAAELAMVPLIEVIQAIFAVGKLRVERFAPLTPRLESMLKIWQQATGGIHPEILYLAQIFWSRVHGLVMLEITNQIPSFFDDPAELFRRELNTILIQYL
jgi:AcrR family transcriptional regulator